MDVYVMPEISKDDVVDIGYPTPPIIPISGKTFGGLTSVLWRLALVTGIAQFSMSVWSWQFGIFMAAIIEPWQIGITFSAGTLATLIGYPLSGTISDFIGRRKTMAISFIPIALGLFLLYQLPIWPLFPMFYGLVQFGWSFIIIITRAAPADEIAQDNEKVAARMFTMVLMPALLIDGLSPFFASILLTLGVEPRTLLIVGVLGTFVAMLATFAFVRETLGTDIQDKAKAGPIISFRGLGSNFWKLAVGLLMNYMAFGLSWPYLGNLSTEAWGIDTAIYGLAWSAGSIAMAVFTYSGGGIANQREKFGVMVSMAMMIPIIFAFSLWEGIPALFLLNILLAFPIVIWIGSERVLIVEGIDSSMKGRALGTYQVLMSSTNLIALNVGAWIWTFSGSLRYLWYVSGWLALLSLIPLGLALFSMKTPSESESKQVFE